MIRIVAPHFVAGVVLEHGHVIEAAPIVRYMIGWPADVVCRYCQKQGWEAVMTA